MSTILLNDTTMIDIANAIRSKTGETNQMLPSEMGGAISNIKTGEKRLIPTKMYCCNNGDENISGSGIVYFNTSSEYHNCTIDNVRLSKFLPTIDTTNGGNVFYYSTTFNESFANTCNYKGDLDYNSSMIVLIGQYSNDILINKPKQISYFTANKTITAQGKGYVELIADNSDYYSRIGQVKVDDVVIKNTNDWCGLNLSMRVRIDFDRNFSITKSPSLANNQDYISGIIYLFD